MTLDPKTYRTKRIAATVPDYAWGGEMAQRFVRRGGVAYWQESLRQAVALRLGGLTGWERVDVNPTVLASVQLDGYRRETVTFTTRPGLSAYGYYLVPDNCPTKRPAVLCLPGHGRGVDSIIGIAEDGTQRKLGAPDEYQTDFALECVARGFPAFALEQISFGYRRDEQAKQAGKGASSCTRDSMAAQMLGESVIGWRVWDAMRAIDYLLTRAEVDPDRIVTMGISGGGLTSLFTAALDTRVACGVVSGYLNTFADSVLAMDHCVDNFAPGLRAVCEMPDIAALVAPRLLFAESGAEDPIFPLPGFEKAVAQVSEVYTAVGAPDNFGHEVFPAGHLFHGVGAFRFLKERFADVLPVSTP